MKLNTDFDLYIKINDKFVRVYETSELSKKLKITESTFRTKQTRGHPFFEDYNIFNKGGKNFYIKKEDLK